MSVLNRSRIWKPKNWLSACVAVLVSCLSVYPSWAQPIQVQAEVPDTWSDQLFPLAVTINGNRGVWIREETAKFYLQMDENWDDLNKKLQLQSDLIDKQNLRIDLLEETITLEQENSKNWQKRWEAEVAIRVELEQEKTGLLAKPMFWLVVGFVAGGVATVTVFEVAKK